MSSSGNWQLRVRPKVQKALLRFPKNDRDKILGVISLMATDPYAGDVVKLGGEEHWRRRVGSYRIFFEILTLEHRIDVAEVDRRGSKTYS